MAARRTLVSWLGRGVALLAACDLPPEPSVPPAPPAPAPPAPDRPGPAIALAAGTFHTCALLHDASVRCWGMGKSGQLGDGAGVQRDVPVPALGLTDVVQLAAEGNRTCAVRRDGRVWCWGHGASAELGDGGPDDRTRPVEIPAWSGVRRLALAMDHDCAITDAGVACRGANTRGALGDGTRDPHDRPVPVRGEGLGPVTDLGLGYGFGCALAPPRVACWGWCADGRCAAQSDADRLTPLVVPDLPPARGLAVGFDHACAALADGTVRCWGANQFGQLGDGTTIPRFAPTAVPDLPPVAAVAAAAHQTTALLSDGTARGWGRDGDRRALWPACADPQTRSTGGRHCALQVADATETFCPQPAPLADLTGVAQVVTASLHACALLRGGQVWCWGSDAYGALGDHRSGDRDTPVQVAL